MPLTNEEQALRTFISVEPQSQYTFDSGRDSAQSEVCRGAGMNEKDCVTLQMNSKRLFEAMQNQGFYCTLPMNPELTHMECKPLPGR